MPSLANRGRSTLRFLVSARDSKTQVVALHLNAVRTGTWRRVTELCYDMHIHNYKCNLEIRSMTMQGEHWPTLLKLKCDINWRVDGRIHEALVRRMRTLRVIQKVRSSPLGMEGRRGVEQLYQLRRKEMRQANRSRVRNTMKCTKKEAEEPKIREGEYDVSPKQSSPGNTEEQATRKGEE